ncbi:hypothetical protein CLU79DRAFT_846723 [Phycomyces nitens]|nr:hypothetical protein CLU79DRAFT_846723 [Phycomyces nitens]
MSSYPHVTVSDTNSLVGVYWFDGYFSAHFGVGAQQEGIHSVAYFMMDIDVFLSECGVVSAQRSEGGGEACLLLIGPWFHRCFGIHYLGNRQVVSNRIYPSPSVIDLAPADMVSDLSSFVQPTKVYRRDHSALWSSASGLRSLVSCWVFQVFGNCSLLRSFQVSSHWFPFQNFLVFV